MILVVVEKVEFVAGGREGLLVDVLQVTILHPFDLAELVEFTLGALDGLLQLFQVEQFLLEVDWPFGFGLFHEKKYKY